MYNYNLPERPLEPPMEWDAQIYDFFDCDEWPGPKKRARFPWYEEEPYEG